MDENIVETLTTDMMGHICDNLCKHPCDKSLTQEELERICDGCKIGHFVCGICNEYNHINDFEKSQISKLLMKLAEAEAALAKMKGETE